jgi:hypothetical protein
VRSAASSAFAAHSGRSAASGAPDFGKERRFYTPECRQESRRRESTIAYLIDAALQSGVARGNAAGQTDPTKDETKKSTWESGYRNCVSLISTLEMMSET